MHQPLSRALGRWEARAIALLVVCAISSSACAPDSESPPSRTERAAQAITDGTQTNGDPSVVPLLRDGQMTCTGTLVSPLVVVTAAHCLEEAPNAIALPNGGHAAIASALSHPKYDSESLANDIGILVLATAVDATWTSPFDSETLDGNEGRTIRLVGYGKSAPDDTVAQKRTGEAKIAALEPTRLVVEPLPSGPCSGDSGGPAFLSVGGREVLAGVVSAGDPTCTGLSHFTRVDSFVPWLRAKIAASAPRSASIGAPCFQPENCMVGTCSAPLDAPSHAYCTTSCTDDATCPSSMHCEKNQCAYFFPSPGATGASCASDEECESTRCASATLAGPGICADLCVADFTTCGAGKCTDDAFHPGESACLTGGETESRGCTASPASSPSSPIVLAIAAALLFGARARRRSEG